MQWLELWNVEYGDCTVFMDSGRSCLMVDCGSINLKLRKPEMEISQLFAQIRQRYMGLFRRDFLLSHYHRDHLCGFQQIIKKDPYYFSNVYLPCLPEDEDGKSPLLELAVLARVFLPPQTDSFQVNTSCLGIFEQLRATVGVEGIFTLGKGDEFSFDKVSYSVLNPPKSGHTFNKLLTDALEEIDIQLTLQPGDWELEFLRAKRRFMGLYSSCAKALNISERSPTAVIVRLLEELADAREDLEHCRAGAYFSPATKGILEIICSQSLKEAYSYEINAASIVFHNRRSSAVSVQDILMTGDAMPETFSRIALSLYGTYNIVKAPHHGTESGFSPVIGHIEIQHLLISSGEYHAAGELCPGYHNIDCVKHCTSRINCRLSRDEGCCNRFKRCGSINGELCLKCPAAKKRGLVSACGIYVMAPGGNNSQEPYSGGSRGCFCDLD